ncbi:clotting factor C-like [Zophobas morio]|uniref:clotting factor C-like n=1 Tax=Zophobas morio TaxID=2755281 RepID=UPI0030833C03
MQLIIKILILYISVNVFDCIHYSGNSSYKRASKRSRSPLCILPRHPTFGKWRIYDNASKLSPGGKVSSRTVLELTCKKSYVYKNSEPFSTCIHGRWVPRIGKCLKTCSTIQSTSLMTATCTFGSSTPSSCANAIDGTVAHFQCAPFYEVPREKKPYRLCSKGHWVGNVPTCVSSMYELVVYYLVFCFVGEQYFRIHYCLLSRENYRTLIVRGSETKKGAYPWQAALYRKVDKTFLCGGSLLNERVILTAAHCITNNQGKLKPAKNYIVAVGKYYREYDHPDDKNAQFCSVHKMFIPREYKGFSLKYLADIALIVTNNAFSVSVNVQPVCTVWQENIHQILTDPNRTKEAYVSGWGYTTEYKNLSSVLKHLKVPLVAGEECSQTLTSEEVEYLTHDKICAGYINSSSSVCNGDSGGGLVTLYENRYHVIGVVSISPRGTTEHGGCDSQQYTLYTKFSEYMENFIYKREAKFRSSADTKIDGNCSATVANIRRPRKCVLPQHSRSGKWNTSFEHQPGQSVASGTTIKVICGNRFKLTRESKITCVNGT